MNSQHELAWCDYAEGVAAMFAGDAVGASAWFTRAKQGMQNAGDTHGLLNVLCAHTTAVALMGGLQAAEPLAQEFLTMADRHGERWLRAYVLWGMGIATWRAGDQDRAAALELESLRLRLAFDDQMGVTWSAEVLGWIAAGAGDPEKAAVLLGAAKHAAETIGVSIASIAFLSDDHTRCEAHLRITLGTAAFEAALRNGGKLEADQILELATGSRVQLRRGGGPQPTPSAHR